jgi:single-stranded DNA-specific DHH superfamily exonuclease
MDKKTMDPRDTFYKKSILLTELANKGILEIAYEGNIGLHELMKFYGVASPEQIETLENYLRNKQTDAAIEYMEKIVGTKLVR